MSHYDDLQWIKNNMGIERPVTSKSEALEILRENQITTTSWVLSALEKEYGADWAEGYRQSIRAEACEHGFICDCPYCKFGTE